MMLSEHSLDSVGDDNVGRFWLHEGEWYSSEGLTRALDQKEMLEAVGLSAERYGQYLRLLAEVGAYRVTRGRRAAVTVCVYRPGIVGSGIVKDIVFCPYGRRSRSRQIEGHWYIDVNW